MALVKCKECGNENSQDATKCPKCGATLVHWYHSTPILMLSFLFCLPVGVPLIWTSPRASKGAKIGAAVFGGLVLLIIVAGALQGGKTYADASKQADAEKTALEAERLRLIEEKGKQLVQAAVQEQPALAVQIGELLSDYKGNELAGDAKYKNRVITTTGKVDDIKNDILNNPYITVGTGADFEVPQLQCSLAKDQVQRAMQLSKGAKVTVTGRVTGLMMNVQASDCRIE